MLERAAVWDCVGVGSGWILDRPSYPYAEVDRLIGLRSGTARRWINGYRRDGKMTTFNGGGATQYVVDIAGYYYRPFHY